MNLIEAIAQQVIVAQTNSVAEEPHEEAEEIAKAALQAIEDAGYVCVPKEPDKKMDYEGYAAMGQRRYGAGKLHINVYKAMLAARPDVEGG